MKTTLAAVLALIVSCDALAVECIKPKYARRALMALYLEQEAPGMSSLSIENRLSSEDAVTVRSPVVDVILCFKQGGYYCPAHKKKWSRQDHKNHGVEKIITLEKDSKITVRETVFLLKNLDAWLEDSECSDF